MVKEIEIVRGEFLVSDIERDILLACRIDAHGTGHRGIGFFPRLHSRSGVQIEARFQARCVKAFEERGGIGEEQLVPRVACPAESLARLICFSGRLELLDVGVLVHVDDEDVEGGVVLAEAANDFLDLLVAVRPVAGPPRAERKTRRKRNAAGDAHIVAKSLAIVVAVTEEVKVLALARRTLDDPRPGAVLALQETEIRRVEERARGVLLNGPAGTRDEPIADGLFGLV